jgi:Na+-translocating ferredoxin:NAD+ oxidoreductase subunit B
MNIDKLYRDLQIHLDQQTIGFPETKSGSDINLLKQLFTPAQAEIVTTITFRFEFLEQIQERAKKIGKSTVETERLLDELADKLIIGRRIINGAKQYKTIPYLVGMIEGALHNSPTPDLLSAHMKYSNDGLFWRDFIDTEIPQMRTIPIRKSITPKHHIGTYDEIKKIIETTADPIVVLECLCRKGAQRSGSPCKQTSRKETCMAFRDMARNLLKKGGSGRQVSREEALKILQNNQDDGLILQPSNSQTLDFLCSCCGCCCGILKVHKYIPNPASHWASNFYAEVDSGLCSGCGSCEERCQVAALKFDENRETVLIDLKRCLGCGLCVEACPADAIELRKKIPEVVPPLTMEDTMEVIMLNKP